MIGIRLKGRLGNQLFIYAFVRALQKKYKQDVLIYDRKDESEEIWHSHLDRYILSKNVKFTSDKNQVMNMGILGRLEFFKDRIYFRNHTQREIYNYQKKNFLKRFMKGLLLLNDGVVELPEKMFTKNLFCDGYFQSARYFDFIRDELLDELTPKIPYNESETGFVKKIERTESVCLTIRLGDYINNSVHQVCTKDFYLKAMDCMKSKYPNCQFFVFSDEVEKAREIFEFKYPVVYDSGESLDVVSLDIMSKCKHFIISNSSFSWWAQYLSRNENKIVISPAKWYAQDVPCDIMQDNWIKLEC